MCRFNLLGSVIRITSSDSAVDGFGTGFPFFRDEQVTYILTCTHVVRAVGGPEKILADGKSANVVSFGSEDDADLAVLSCRELSVVPLLHLSTSGKTGQAFVTAGYQGYNQNKSTVSRPLHGVLGEQVMIASKASFQGVEAWDLKIRGDDQLEPGYSGSPVVLEINSEASNNAIAVVSTKKGGLRGVATSVKALRDIWPSMPFSLEEEALVAPQAIDVTSTDEPSHSQAGALDPATVAEPLTSEERQKLITLLCGLPDIEYATVRHSLVSTLPAKPFQSNLAFDKLPNIHITEIVDMVSNEASLQLFNGHYPITVVIQNAINREKRAQSRLALQTLLDTVMMRLGVVPRIDTTKSLEICIHYLDNFIHQMPALQYDLQRISDLFNDHVRSSDCKAESAHLAEACIIVSDCLGFVKQCRDIEIVSQRLWLMNTIQDFTSLAELALESIDDFCITAVKMLERNQYNERIKIQRQLDALLVRSDSVLREACNLYSKLVEPGLNSS